VPISVFFGQAPPFAPIFHYVQRRIQYIQIADFCCFPLFRKALCDLFVLFFLQFHSFIIAYLYLCEQTLGLVRKINIAQIAGSCKNRDMKRYELAKGQWECIKELLPLERAGKRG
jgi:hypothetical protein